MGIYSSWALLAHFHHMVVRFSADRVGIRRFVDYRVLGDDIVIRNDKVAESYREVKSAFGIGISKEKSIVSQNTFEFAKRFFFQGTEVTGFPVAQLEKPDWLSLTHAMRISISRGFSRKIVKDSRLIPDLFDVLGNRIKSRSFRDRLSRKVRTQIIKRDTNLSLESRLEKVRIMWNLPFSCNNVHEKAYLYRQTFHQTVLTDVDKVVASSFELSFNVDRETCIPAREDGSTGNMTLEHSIPLVKALNKSVQDL
jgi:hypothetical protein